MALQIPHFVQHTLAVRGVTFLKTPADGKTAMREIKTLQEK
jgi:hypothetical protein